MDHLTSGTSGTSGTGSDGYVGLHARGWLSDQAPEVRRQGPRALVATAATVGLHVLLLLGLLIVFTHRAEIRQVMVDRAPLTFAFLQQAGPGGGGGGSPAPAPPRPIAVPRTPPPPVPNPFTPSVVPPPPPTLSARVMTVNHDLAQSIGASAASLADLGGGGRRNGSGPGDGDGVGDGRTQGFGGNGYRRGTGVRDPTVLKEVRPTYTSEAMKAKIQGNVRLEALVDENGLVNDVRVVRSLDRQYGLDQQAMNAARLWIFRPARDPNNRPVPVLVEFELSFALH